MQDCSLFQKMFDTFACQMVKHFFQFLEIVVHLATAKKPSLTNIDGDRARHSIIVQYQYHE